MVLISPSVLSCDYSIMGSEFENAGACGADWLHIDVMDGHFVPNITLGAPIVKCLRKCSELVFDVHLMISDPVKYAPDFVKAGADMITFHAESDCDMLETIRYIKSLGCKVGVALKPSTPAQAVYDVLDEVDMILVMTVEPGFGGQSFMEDMMPKVRAVRDECNRRSLHTDIQVDGGISLKTIEKAAAAGANVFVAGSAVFTAEDRKGMISSLRSAAEGAYRR